MVPRLESDIWKTGRIIQGGVPTVRNLRADERRRDGAGPCDYSTAHQVHPSGRTGPWRVEQ
eukprot:370930-Karenia_brevis.AAC.1